ncbi:MAG: restriction endonuclease subunit S [Tateyamaria sp.]|jgi:type I restriction enzyme S subunit|uniref:restriction endonuclease subunit S n=1 Tax=Tateyamaria sp. TaxID=1929288 RepID=UPI0032DDB3BD
MNNERWPLPVTWSWVSSADIAKIAGGGTPRADDERNFSEDGIKWITPADLTGYSDVYIGSGRRDLSEQGLSSSGATLLPKGTVLFSSRAPVGYCAIAANEISTNQGFKSLVLEDEILPEYVRHYLLSAKEYAESLASGTTFLELSGKRMAELKIPLAPVSAQKRIVRKLDSLSARTTAARTHLTAISKLVERQKLAVLGHLFGKSGSDPKPTEHLWAIPASWEWKKVKEIGEVGLGRQRSPENHQGPDMRPYIRSANITWSGVDTTDVKEMNFDAADFKRFELNVGDVLLNEGSGSAKEVGKPAIWRGEIPNCCFQNTVLRVQPRDCSSEYVYWYFLLTALSEGFVKDTKGVNIQHIGKGGLANFPIPLPPPEEQDEIVHRIETALTEIDRIAAEAEKALKLTDRLDERILAKAFAGELVPQDPNDEPASGLLDRIREARANAPKKTRPRRTKATAMKKDPKDLLLADSAKWPANGVTSEELAKRVVMPPDNLRDALFELLGGTKPQLEQVFDKTEERMRLKRAAQ